ncbi:MAG: GNAT family N-acetyltransferase [Myxococcales bacterium]|nr:GNAT family N-acetyltransferase [Myxococcales bacterium]
MDPVRRFDSRYAEEVVLTDGTRVLLRLLRPTDKELVRGGFAALSLRSRYRRFLTSKARLSDRELAYLTELDHERHFALGALCVDGAGKESGVGIARFVRSAEQPDIAEPAVVVIDRLHGRGLGRILCERLAEAARERGVRAFRCEVLATNSPMRALIDSLSPHAKIEQHGEAATIEFALDASAPTQDLAPSPPQGRSVVAAPSAAPAAGEADEASPAASPTMIRLLLRLASRGAMVVIHRALARWVDHEA